jgi:hypothetical protein
MLVPGGVLVAKELLGELVAAAGRPAGSTCNALEVASALVSDRDAVLAAIAIGNHPILETYHASAVLLAGYFVFSTGLNKKMLFLLCVTTIQLCVAAAN